ncbi:MAG: GGDEF domain-containing protein, partial [candidate division WOR-3 bacterium]
INLAKVVSYKASIFDSLTGLYTRGFFEERMKSEIEKIKRGGGRFTLVMLDIDNLKYINDKFGHDKGDEVILRFASSLKSQTRQSDLPARWGGDEFVLILSGVSEEKADEVVNRILKRFHSEDIQFSEPDFKPGVSYAVVEYNESSHFGLAELFKIVDSRLLEVKRKKKGG